MTLRGGRPAGAGRWVRVALLLLAVGPSTGGAQEPPGPVEEHAVKAAFLVTFARYAEWPAETFAAPDAELVIGVLPPDPFGAHLAAAVKDKKVGARRLVVRSLAEAKDWAGIHMLFVPAGYAGKRQEALDAVRGKPVLTVGESDGFARDGGVLNLYLEAGSVKFEASIAAAERQKLVLSSKLLKLARIVAEKGGR